MNMNRIDKKFQELQRNKKKAFIAFITAGFPNLSSTKNLVLELERQGVDIIELGVPFSDPLADGPVIQRASQYSLENGTNLDKILLLVKELRSKTQIPVCLMTYYNPVLKYGLEALVKKAVICGVDGFIIPDLPFEEAKEFLKISKKKNIDLISFLAPTSSLERIKMISKASHGFIYYVSLTGVTGTRERLPRDLTKNISFIKRYTNKAICVGFGISKPEHIKAISRLADGVIVGSAIVKEIEENLTKNDMIKKVGKFVKNLTCNLN